MSKIPWMEELIEGTLADGTPVRANCWYWAKDVNVEMISPFPGRRDGVHMMYMCPRRFTDGDLWKQRALEMIDSLVKRGRWVEAHPNAVKNRRREGSRRIGIVVKYIKKLKDERSDWKRKLKQGLVDPRTYQQHIHPINKAISSLEMIGYNQDEDKWLRDGIVEPFSVPVRLPCHSKHPGMKKICVFLQDSTLVSDAEKGWSVILETEVPEADLAAAGLGNLVDGRTAIDPASLSSYLNRADDKTGLILDAWREIARETDSWCATVA